MPVALGLYLSVVIGGGHQVIEMIRLLLMKTVDRVVIVFNDITHLFVVNQVIVSCLNIHSRHLSKCDMVHDRSLVLLWEGTLDEEMGVMDLNTDYIALSTQ